MENIVTSLKEMFCRTVQGANASSKRPWESPGLPLLIPPLNLQQFMLKNGKTVQISISYVKGYQFVWVRDIKIEDGRIEKTNKRT